jgi:glycine dehydrogenase subunit 1
MRFLPHTPEEIAEMLRVTGAESLDALFSAVPDECRRKQEMNLPEPQTEWELNNLMSTLAATVAVPPKYKLYLGAGSYEHHIPYAVSYLLGRSEFLTSYTPYQAEVSQGTLQAIYEYQTLTARLLGMEVANASMYDGASALAEALLMALRITRRKRVALSGLIHPHYRRVVRTYLEPTGFDVVELPRLENGRTDPSLLPGMDKVAAVAVQSPNFFGCVEDLTALAEKAHEAGALFVVAFTEPLAYGLFKNPGSLGADIACGEGQSLGVPASFGGPGLGMFTSKMKYVRNMPGRLVGQTVDLEGKRGFVLTLATREQHIRREKATSNICTNHSHCALAAVMYMASLGGTGFRELAHLNRDKSEYLKDALGKLGFTFPFSSPTFNEFVAEAPTGFDKTYQHLLEKNIVAGFPLASFFADLPKHYLFCVTETKTREDMDALVKEIQR